MRTTVERATPGCFYLVRGDVRWHHSEDDVGRLLQDILRICGIDLTPEVLDRAATCRMGTAIFGDTRQDANQAGRDVMDLRRTAQALRGADARREPDADTTDLSRPRRDCEGD